MTTYEDRNIQHALKASMLALAKRFREKAERQKGARVVGAEGEFRRDLLIGIYNGIATEIEEEYGIPKDKSDDCRNG